MTDMTVNTVELEEVASNDGTERLLKVDKLNLVADVRVELTVELGNAELTVQQLFDLKKNGVLKLDANVNSDLLIKLNGNVVATGKLVAVDDNFGVQITQVTN